VVGQEIKRIAAQVAAAFVLEPSWRHAPLWGDFATALNKYLALIESNANQVVTGFGLKGSRL
jgi:hypothetical protein